jgi:hypothetical protein
MSARTGPCTPFEHANAADANSGPHPRATIPAPSAAPPLLGMCVAAKRTGRSGCGHARRLQCVGPPQQVVDHGLGGCFKLRESCVYITTLQVRPKASRLECERTTELARAEALSLSCGAAGRRERPWHCHNSQRQLPCGSTPSRVPPPQSTGRFPTCRPKDALDASIQLINLDYATSIDALIFRQCRRCNRSGDGERGAHDHCAGFD